MAQCWILRQQCCLSQMTGRWTRINVGSIIHWKAHVTNMYFCFYRSFPGVFTTLLVQKCQLNKLSMFHVDESSEIVMSNKNVSMYSNHVDILQQCLDVRWVWIGVYCVCNASEIWCSFVGKSNPAWSGPDIDQGLMLFSPQWTAWSDLGMVVFSTWIYMYIIICVCVRVRDFECVFLCMCMKKLWSKLDER